IGRPQPAFVALVDEGVVRGSVFDAGCGTGEHTLLAASRGAKAYGVDMSPTAIDRARAKAAERGLDVRFEAGDLLTLPLPQAAFDTVLDSGVFHSFDDDERPRYVSVLSGIARPGAMLCLMCFSERQPGEWGPRRVTEAELRASFADGWSVERIEPATFEINPLPDAESVDAWLAIFRRLQ
ncbi:MAG: class I SAM-dependent methyltransferase, partial [Frankiaceae bacterium]|nr:class I SAM-dependent methyltransferase [Frankiaceae bacterium]